MVTKTVTLTAGAWVSVYEGPTAAPLAVELASGGSDALMAISSVAPADNSGHRIVVGKLRNVVLEDGENLFVRAGNAYVAGGQQSLVVTD